MAQPGTGDEPPLAATWPAQAPASVQPPPPPAFAPPPPPVFAPPGAPGTSPSHSGPRPLPPPTAETLAIPLGPRRLVGTSLDLLTRSDAGLRSASFYIGFLMLLMVGPAVALFGLAMTTGAADVLVAGAGPREYVPPEQLAWFWWLLLALLPASLGFVAASVEARTLAAAIIGGRAEGRPLRLRESIAVTRSRFWSVLGVQLMVGLLSGGIELAIDLLLVGATGRVDALSYGVSVVVGLVVGTPFVYSTAGIVLGEASAVEAMRRSIRLARARKRLAVTVTLFSVLAGLVVSFGLGIAADTVARVLSGSGLVDAFPPGLVVPLAAALVFAYGTLVLLTEAIAAAPAVHAFVALTHYTGGLEQGRREPLAVQHVWDPWFTPGFAIAAATGVLALVVGVLAMPWAAPA